MTKNIFVSYSRGKLAFIFMILSVVGIAFQYSVLYAHLVPYFGDDGVTSMSICFGTLALVAAGLAIILATYRIPKWAWISLSSVVFISIMMLPSVFGGILGFFPYVLGDVFTMPWIMLAGLPIYPGLDFIGFWIAVGGSLFSLIASLGVPKK